MEKIKLLREKTGAGMVDCKKALDEANGDLEKAIEILRKKGIAKAAKRDDRETKEGMVKFAVSDDSKKAIIIEFGAETDFVVRNEQFQKFAEDVVALAKVNWPTDLEALLNMTMADGNSVKSNLDNMSGVIGEKLSIGKMNFIETTGVIGAYLHANNKLGALVALSGSEADLARDIAMQVAGANPKYITPAEVEQSEIDKEKDVYSVQLKAEGKPEQMIEKIMEGKLAKFYEGICLVKQEYIKDDKLKVEQVLKGATVEKFVRYSL